METEVLVAIISASTLLVVAVLGLVPVCLDSRRAKREQHISEKERMNDATVKLLRHLANFRHTEQKDQAAAAGLRCHQQATAEMRGAYDAWALAVMPRLDACQQKRVREIRTNELGRDNIMNTEAKDMSISEEIYNLTIIARNNVE